MPGFQTGALGGGAAVEQPVALPVAADDAQLRRRER